MASRALDLEIAFRLPLPSWPRAVFQSDYTLDGGRLTIDGHEVAMVRSRAELERGVRKVLPLHGAELLLRLASGSLTPDLRLTVDGRPALREDALRAPPSPSAWTHAVLALGGSAAGFASSWLYLQKAHVLGSEWALKMGTHTAGWHLLLTLTLFPASVWGQRLGIRIVQWVSGLFFLIHAGIALANLGPGDPGEPNDVWIATFNALSGLLFLASALYGNRAHRDMDPVAALQRTAPVTP